MAELSSLLRQVVEALSNLLVDFRPTLGHQVGEELDEKAIDRVL